MRILLVFGLLLSIVAPTPAQNSTAQQTPERLAQTSDQAPADKLILSNVLVMTKEKGYVTGLSKDDFTILDNKIPRAITYFSTEDKPISIAVLLDLSRSMNGGVRVSGRQQPLVKLFGEYFSEFIKASNPANEYFVIGFSNEPELLAEGVQGDQAIATVSSLLSSTKPKGNTAFYDACYLGIEKVMQGKYLKKAILVFSDGVDNNSKHKLDDLRRLIKETAVMFFATHIQQDGFSLLRETEELIDLAAINGSWAYFPNNIKELIAVLNIFAARLRNQYTLGFIPENNVAGDKWHRLKVEVKLPSNSSVKRKDISIQSRTGYYAAQ